MPLTSTERMFAPPSASPELPASLRVPAPGGERVRNGAAATGKAVLVHGGARDAYQLALALSEAGLLEALVTDLFWSEESDWAKTVGNHLPAGVLRKLRQRGAPGLPAGSVSTCVTAGLGGLMMDRLRQLPFGVRRRWARAADAKLGAEAGRLARRTGAGLVSYSYFGYDAFKAYGQGGMLFQVHPHPATMRRILREELQRHPDCASSLQTEWEMALPEEDFQHLVDETAMAACYLAASTFTRQSLIENGAPAGSIAVVPYGVDLERFKPSASKPWTRTPRLRLLFVGRINQRKGVKYLLESLRLLAGSAIELTICGRAVDDLQLFAPYRAQIEIRTSVSSEELVKAYQSADLFVFPSVGEGFGQVLLEALACGLPILATTHTAAPDLIEDGEQGFVVEPRRPELLADRIDWAARNRGELLRMGERARQRAERFTWDRFRTGAAEAVRGYLDRQNVGLAAAAAGLKRGAA
jgi:glycosyltransferase involved in cell wall biosynthesis